MRENLKLRQKLTNEVVFERLPIVFQGFHPNVFSFSSEVCQWRELERNQRPDDWELLTQLGAKSPFLQFWAWDAAPMLVQAVIKMDWAGLVLLLYIMG